MSDLSGYKCSACKGSGRKPMGFFTVVCDECEEGQMTVDQIWQKRDQAEIHANGARLITYRGKMSRYKRGSLLSIYV